MVQSLAIVTMRSTTRQELTAYPRSIVTSESDFAMALVPERRIAWHTFGRPQTGDREHRLSQEFDALP